MNSLLYLLLAIFVLGLALGLYAWRAPKKTIAEPDIVPPPGEPWKASSDWTAQAGEEFAGLSESARCDLIFAVTDLHDARSERLLLHALDDPADAVALAAAHALRSRGQSAAVDAYAQQHPGERGQRLLETLRLLS